jgi:hexosaminidase
MPALGSIHESTIPFVFALAAGLAAAPRAAAAQQPVVDVIPYPAHVERTGDSLTFAGAPVIVATSRADTALARLAQDAAQWIGEPLGRSGSVAVAAPRGRGAVFLAIDAAFPDTSDEAYRLVSDAKGVHITARGHAGLFYGVQTLRQLVAPRRDGWAVPGVRITDRPRFVWRGLHLDVGRHFFPVAEVKRYIDLMARYKLNTFHWHLTEDQGWRIEIKRYPWLTQVGAYRKETMVARHFDPYDGDGVPYGGYYTQDEIRDVVRYAAQRYVTVVPEIEMPGHSLAALTAYPELACTSGPFHVATQWGVFEDIYCPTEKTFAFLEGVLTEVMELFPSRYIHVGGDEAPKFRWHDSPVAQAVMQQNGLANEEELQSYFIKRIEQFLSSHGRRLVGWDEILEGGLPPEATVMSWRGTEGGIAAARADHDVVMTPGDFLYFDHLQGEASAEPLGIGGYVPLERVYEYEPVPDSLTPEQATHILGAQGNMWTEYVATPEHLEYMVYPRALALAEVTWSPREARSWASFQARLPSALAALERAGVNFRIPAVRGLDGDRLTLDSAVTVTLSSPLPQATIHYTTDGSEPTDSSPGYAGPVRVTLALDQPARFAARLVLPDGRAGPVSAAVFTHPTLRPADQVNDADLSGGLRYDYFERSVNSVWQLPSGAVPTASGTAGRIALKGTERSHDFVVHLTGFLRVPADGIYRFTLLSDDGAVLAIGDSVVVDNDRSHRATASTGSVALRSGDHAFSVSYFQSQDGKVLGLFVTPPGGEQEEVPADWLRRR